MATESHVFSSPPGASLAGPVITVSSSPEFPSIGDLITYATNKPPLRSLSQSIPVYESGLKFNTTASASRRSNVHTFEDDSLSSGTSELVKLEHETRRKSSTPTIVTSHSAVVATSDVQSVVTAPPGPQDDAPKPKRTTRPRAKKAVASEGPGDTGVPPKARARRKTKEKDTDGGQATLPKGKVTKATATKPKQTRKRAEAVSKHFPAAAAHATAIELDELIELEPALARRTDWTPTKDTVASLVAPDSSTTKVSITSGLGGTAFNPQPGKGVFMNLRDTYGCANEDERRKVSPTPGDTIEILGKRKLIEMVITGGPATLEVSPTKPKAKAVKKKPRTITDLATAAYRVTETTANAVDADQSKEDSLLNYFNTERDTASGAYENEKAAGNKAKAAKPVAKSKSKRVSKKKAAAPQPVLLSPTSALRQVSRQDFVFGTSSQLATEEDAGLLRDIQLAMTASNHEQQDNPFASSVENSSVAIVPPRTRLWAAGARNVDGHLLQVEVIDLVNSPTIPKDLTNRDVILSLVEPEPPKAPQPHPSDDQKLSLSNGVKSINLLGSCSVTSQSPAQPKSHFFLTQNNSTPTSAPKSPLPPSSVLLTDFSDWDDEPPASNQEQFQLMASQAAKSPTMVAKSPLAAEPAEAVPGPVKEAPVPAIPKYELFTDATLAKEIKRYGFKPIKRRAAAVALLTECWLSKNKNKLPGVGQAQGTTASMSMTANPAAKAATTSSEIAAAARPRGRPKKGASIPSETEGSVPPSTEASKKPRGRPKKDAGADVTATTTRPAPKPRAKATTLPTPSETTDEVMARPSTPKRRKKTPPREIVEIADSDMDDLDPFLSSPLSSPPLSPEPANEFSPLPPDISMTEDDSLTLTPTGVQTKMFGHITDAVKTGPRSTDPENPSWHDKMLMYDPVVLEDLTAWLNSGELDRVGWDGQVSTADVKKWCESRSVCCLWKVTNNGKDRARF